MRKKCVDIFVYFLKKKMSFELNVLYAVILKYRDLEEKKNQ
jgi:hypothetical protein